MATAPTDDRRATPDASASLDHQRLSVEPAPPTPLERSYIFGRKDSDAIAWQEAFDGSPAHRRESERCRTCGVNAWVQWSPSRQCHRVIADTCKLRSCPRCQNLRARKIAERTRTVVADKRKPRTSFLTLTLRHSSAPLPLQLERLKKTFRRLRQRKLWRSTVASGIAVMEISYSEETQHWHPHLHLVIKCDWIDQKKLSAEWLSVTGDSKIVDIRPCRRPAEAAAYITKYVTKTPAKIMNAGPTVMLAYYDAIKATRLLIAFGKPDPTEPDTLADDTRNDWTPIMSLHKLILLADRGDLYCVGVLNSLRTKGPGDAGESSPEKKRKPPG